MIDMCNALEELRQEGYQEGYRRGYQEGRQEERLHSIQVVIRICQEYNKDVAVEKLIECYIFAAKNPDACVGDESRINKVKRIFFFTAPKKEGFFFV